MGKTKFLKLIVSIAISTVSTIYLLSKIDFNIVESLTVNYVDVILAGILMSGGYAARSFYYKITLRADSLKLREVFAVTAIYNFLSSVVPFAIGHYSYIYFLKKYFQIKRTISFSSLTSFHLFKIILLLLILVISISLASPYDLVFSAQPVLRLILFVCGILIVAAFFWKLSSIFSSATVVVRFKDILSQVVEEFRTYKSLSLFLRLFFLTVINLIIAMCYFHWCLSAFGMNLGLLNLMMVFSVSNLSAVLPIHGYGRIGSQEILIATLLIILGYEKEFSIRVSFASHFLELFLQGTYAIFSYLLIVIREKKMQSVPNLEGDSEMQ